MKGDKSTNYYKLEKDRYNELLEKEIKKEYKKENQKEVDKIDSEHIKIVNKLELQDRVFETTPCQAFITLKDHKEGFVNNPKVRLINPCKNEIGRIAKKILEKVNTAVRTKSGLKQWTSTGDAVKWFKNIERKKSKKFIVCDVVNFYPTIKEELLRNSLIWAHQYI